MSYPLHFATIRRGHKRVGRGEDSSDPHDAASRDPLREWVLENERNEKESPQVERIMKEETSRLLALSAEDCAVEPEEDGNEEKGESGDSSPECVRSPLVPREDKTDESKNTRARGRVDAMKGRSNFALGWALYKGQFIKDLPETDWGTLKFHNGDAYVGEFKAGKLDGVGKMTFHPNSNFMVGSERVVSCFGEFVKNALHGLVRVETADGRRSMVLFENGQFLRKAQED